MALEPEERAQVALEPEDTPQPALEPEERAQVALEPEDTAPPALEPEDGALVALEPEDTTTVVATITEACITMMTEACMGMIIMIMGMVTTLDMDTMTRGGETTTNTTTGMVTRGPGA